MVRKITVVLAVVFGLSAIACAKPRESREDRKGDQPTLQEGKDGKPNKNIDQAAYEAKHAANVAKQKEAAAPEQPKVAEPDPAAAAAKAQRIDAYEAKHAANVAKQKEESVNPAVAKADRIEASEEKHAANVEKQKEESVDNGATKADKIEASETKHTANVAKQKEEQKPKY